MLLVRKCSWMQHVHVGLPNSSLLRDITLACHRQCVELILSVSAFFKGLLFKCQSSSGANLGIAWRSAQRGKHHRARLCVFLARCFLFRV